MALEGSLKEFGLADILQLIYFQRKTGILTLESRMDKVRLLFYEGNIVSAESKRRIEANRLGKALVKKALIKDEDLQKILEEQKSTGAKVGDLLIKKGLVGKEQIIEIVTSQISETVIQLFSWKEGMYEFSPQGVPVDKEIPVSLDTQHLLMEGLRIIDEWSLIEGKLTLEMMFEQTEKSDVELNSEEKEIFRLVDGISDVSEIIDNSSMDNFQTSKVLVSLMEKGVIRPKEAAPVISVTVPPVTVIKEKKKLTISFSKFVATFITIIAFLGSAFVAIAAVLVLLQKNADFDRIRALEDIDSIRFRIEAYRYEHGSYPKSINQITQSDRWGRSYIYKVEDNSFIIFSKGPDGKEGTEDDIY